MVHQHFMLVPVLTVAENIVLGDESMTAGFFLDRKKAHERIIELGRRFGFEVDPEVKVGSLSVGWQQRVEILKALYRDAKILVLDEPTAVLTPQETEEIFEVLRRLAAEGHSIVFISHKLYEVLEIADRITVIRRGKVVGQRIPSETNEEDLAELMVGREVSLTVDRGESHPAAGTLHVEGLVVKRRPRPGGGPWHRPRRPRRARSSASPASPATARTSWSRRSSGCASPPAARSRSRARTSPGRRRATCTAPGVAYVPADRHRFGLVLSFSIADNLVLTSYHRQPYARGILRNDAAIREMAEERIKAFDIRTTSADGEGGRRCRAATSRRSSSRASSLATCGSSSSTSRPAASTSAASSSSTSRRSPSATPGRPSCSSRPSSTRSSSCPTGSRSSTAGGSSPSATVGRPTRTRSAC